MTETTFGPAKDKWPPAAQDIYLTDQVNHEVRILFQILDIHADGLVSGPLVEDTENRFSVGWLGDVSQVDLKSWGWERIGA